MSLLEVSDLEAGYGPVTVLRGISFSVDEGRIVTVLGPNGAGKTTTLRALSGMVRRSGRIHFDGKDVSRHSPEKMARSVVVLPAPFAPRSDTTSPSSTASETPCRARIAP